VRRIVLATLLLAVALANAAPAAAAGDLAVEVSGPADPVVAGTTATYAIEARNIGDAPLSDVSISTSTPSGTTFTSFTAPAGWVSLTPPVGGTGGVSPNKPSVAPGEVARFELVVTLDASRANGTSLSLVVNGTSNPADGNGANNSDDTTTISIRRADLGVEITGPSVVAPGATVSYTISVTNNGPSDAREAGLEVGIPEGTDFSAISNTSGPPWGVSLAGDAVYANVSTFASGATSTFSLEVTAQVTLPDPTTFTAPALVVAETTDPVASNDRAAALTTAGTKADLRVTSVAEPGSVEPGDELTFRVTLANAGIDAQNAALTIPLPAGTTFVSNAQEEGPAFTCTTPAAGVGGSVNCTLATFGARASATFRVTARVGDGVPRPSRLETTAAASTSTAEADASNDSATAGADVTAPPPPPPPPQGAVDLVTTASAKPKRPRRGQTTRVRFRVTNRGDLAATNVVLAARLPRGLGPRSATTQQGTCTIAGRRVTCALTDLAPGASALVAIRARASRRGKRTARGTATSAGVDRALEDNAASVVIRVRRGK
jgi:uncharacterized repeat protein (TIGR01451 family)